MNRSNDLILMISFLFILSTIGLSQVETIDDVPKVYIDSRMWVWDYDYIRTEITYVNYVRQRQDADIHILIRSQPTGGGGQKFTLTFIGQNNFEGIDDTLFFASDPTDTEDIIRQEMVRVIKLGLVHYLSRTSLAKNLSISFLEPEEETVQEVLDKWKNWVFTVEFSPYARGEETTNTIRFWGSLTAKKVTDEWKIQISANGNYTEDNFESGRITSISRSQRLGVLMARSISDHWSIGIGADVNSSTYSNIDYEISFAPILEYNIYPYSESTDHELQFLYSFGPNYRDYTEETIYLKLDEELLGQSLDIRLYLNQPWGSIGTNLEGSHYFHDFERNRIVLNANFSLKVFKGLSLNINGRVARIHDQLSIPSGGATLEQILLRRKELATQYRYWFNMGFSYSFGSIYSNIVNPRFGSFWW